MFQNWEFASGPITLEGRKILLGMLLEAQEESEQELISIEEIDAIVEAWREDGYEATLDDLTPRHFDYDGPLLLTPDARINHKTTKNPNPVFSVCEDFDMSLDKLVSFLKERALKTGKHLYYFITCVDYHRDFQMSKSDPILNQVQFIVCEKEIATQREAQDYVQRWLGADELDEEPFDLDSFMQKHSLVSSLL